MGITAMAVGGTCGILAKGTVNRLMKVSLRRGEQRKRKATTGDEPSKDSESTCERVLNIPQLSRFVSLGLRGGRRRVGSPYVGEAEPLD